MPVHGQQECRLEFWMHFHKDDNLEKVSLFQE